jgi:DNA-binding transcriptional ArsR family regulator
MTPPETLFKALADPHRRRVLAALREGPRSAGELAQRLPITKGTLSHHLNILKSADLVRVERQGQQRVYSLNTTVVDDMLTVLAELFGTKEGKSHG